jgi:hypothetical protein
MNISTILTDVVEYRLMTVDATRASTAELWTKVMQVVWDDICMHTWHQDAFQLVVRDEEGWHLYGKSYVGDNVMDEWYIVYLLVKISRRFVDVRVSVVDGDGEVLLIEAAEHLEDWMQPDVVKDRVYIKEGLVHVVPRSEREGEVGKLGVLAKLGVGTQAPSAVQGAIAQRLAVFPEILGEHVHYTRCTVPRQVAHVLYHDPKLVAHAVAAFYTRDPVQVRKASWMKQFPPEDMVTTTIQMTRAMYAQLTFQQFHAPKRYPMPPEGDAGFPAADVGLKVTVGLEILCLETVDREAYEVDAAFKERFAGHEMDVWQLFRQFTTGEWMPKDQIAVHRVQHALAQPMVAPHLLISNQEASSDDWLTINEGDLESTLAQFETNFTPMDETLSESDDDSDAAPVDDLYNRVDTFMAQEADAEGAELPRPSTLTFNPDLFLSILQQIGEPQEEVDSMDELDAATERELASTTLTQSFAHVDEGTGLHMSTQDMHVNLYKNMMASIQAQQGQAGPGSTLLHKDVP